MNLSDADVQRISALAGANGLTVERLLQNFIGALVDGTYRNGSDERLYAKRWLERCWFAISTKPDFLRCLLDSGYDPEDASAEWQTSFDLYWDDYVKQHADHGTVEKEMQTVQGYCERGHKLLGDRWQINRKACGKCSRMLFCLEFTSLLENQK